MQYKVSHPGVPGVELLSADSPGQAREKFREIHGKIQTCHKYTIHPVGVDAPPPVEIAYDEPTGAEPPAPEPQSEADAAPPPVEPPPVDPPSEPTDPTLAELGIYGENAELLAGEGLATLSAIKEYAHAHEGLQAIHDVGPKREQEIFDTIRTYLESLERSDHAE